MNQAEQIAWLRAQNANLIDRNRLLRNRPDLHARRLADFLMGPWVTVNENHVHEADELLAPWRGQ